MDEWQILVVDDDSDVARAMADALESGRMHCEIASTGAAALAACRALEFDAVVTDIQMEGLDGEGLFLRLKQQQPDLPVIFVTGAGTIAAAVAAVKRGAFEYLAKPCDGVMLRRAVEQAIAFRGRPRRILDSDALPEGTEELTGSSSVMVELRSRIALVARANSPVLVQGETGTGKELVARAIHACSARRSRRFVTVNASAIPESLLESEMFGHVRGAFTGATQSHRGLFSEADRGTLLLDEIGDMPLQLQPKLLRVLQTGELRAVGATKEQHVDVRVIAATHRSLPELVSQGRFREDLFYRLNVVAVTVPPLRARTDDVAELAEKFLARARIRVPSTPARTMTSELVALLTVAAWPGNVRELESMIERLVVLAQEEELGRADLLRAEGEQVSARSVTDDTERSLDGVIRRHVQLVLARTGGNRATAAKVLRVDPSTLYRWQRRWARA